MATGEINKNTFPGIQGLWHLSDVNDSSNNAYNLTNNNTTTFIPGKFSNCAHFVAASSQYLSIANASCPNLEVAGAQTWMCWIRPTTNISYTVPMGKVKADNSVHKYLLHSNDAGGQFYFRLDGLTTNTQVASNGIAPAGVWTLIAGVYTGAFLQTYINGKLDNQVPATGSATATTGSFCIGGDGVISQYVNGDVDEAVFCNVALTPKQIKDYYAWAVGRRTNVA